MKIGFLIIVFFVGTNRFLFAQSGQRDTLLPNTTVISNIRTTKVATAFPAQTLTGEEISQTGSLSVADAAKYFSGVQVKDYGGVGGLKTISVRSLGANQVNVLYDGVVMPTGQGGQIDLGRISVNNISSISLYNAQPSEILNTARAFSAASLLVVETKHKVKTKIGQPFYRFGVGVGPFQMFNPNGNASIILSKRWELNASADVLTSKGNYPFIDYVNGDVKTRRKNSDVTSIATEANILYSDSLHTDFSLKAYYYNSNRGLPGGIVYANFYSAERLSDKNFFVQSRFKKGINPRIQILFNVRYTYFFNHYKNPGTPAQNASYENIFSQYEYYASSAIKYKLAKYLTASYVIDYFYSRLLRTDSFATRQFFPKPERNTVLNNIALQANSRGLEVQASLLYTYLKNQTKIGETGLKINKLTPTVSVMFQPFAWVPFRIRAFYKNILRAPSFDDLYYTNIGNTRLKPEYARQFNLGVTYLITNISLLKRLVFTLDAYHNDVSDKIVAVPRDNLFQWSMQNLGVVKINGVDAVSELLFDDFGKWKFKTNISYTYQKAIDMTDASSVLYKEQIPYTPKHSGSFSLLCQNSFFSFAYTLLASSYRYRVGETIKDNYLKGWVLHNVTLHYRPVIKKLTPDFFVEANNIFNTQYEIVKYYPMPGFTYRAGFNIDF